MRSVVKLVSSLFVVLALSGLGRSPSILAQDAANPFADLGLPEIAVTITETAIEGAPSELAAGRYVLAVTNATDGEDDIGAAFIQPPDGISGSDFASLFAPPAGSPEAAGDAAASPDAQPLDEGVPPWYYEVAMAGGTYAAAGATAYGVVDLAAGEWALWAEDPAAPQPPVGITVTGDAPTDPPAPTADVTIEATEMAFALEGTLTAGPQIIEFRNAGAQPHFVFAVNVPAGTTADDFLALAATFEDPSATPPAGLSFDQVVPGFNTGDQSAGVTSWLAADLEAGDYVIVCFVPDQATGTPHAFMGMIDVITVQ